MLLESSSLTARWTELLTTASRVEIAVAWITNSDRVDDLLAFAAIPGHQVRVIVGVRDYLTSPNCLRRLHNAEIVKIGVGKGTCTFHPKLYLFTLADRMVCWVGSANLTTSGFGENTELMHEFADDGMASAWFAHEWNSCEYPTLEWLDEYEQRTGTIAPNLKGIDQMPSPVPAIHPLESWSAFYGSLLRADKQWAVKYAGEFGIFSGRNTYLKTIRVAQPLITKDWAVLSTTEARILLGLIDDDGTDYGQLGSMKGAGIAKNVFLEAKPKNLKTRQAIHDAIVMLRKVPLNSSLPLMARKAHEVITNREGFDVGVATRLLALARPEVLISVNSESVERLAQWSGLPAATIRTSAGYEKLVKWIMSGKWWNCPEPKEALEREAWSYRAALIDGLIYEGHHIAAHS